MFLQKKFYLTVISLIFICSFLKADETLLLRDNLKKANPGDFIVISANKTDTLMHIYDKQNNVLTIEEISIPEVQRKKYPMNWKEWVSKNAPSNTSWVMYDIDISTGEMIRYYSFSKNGWFEIPDADNFISKLLNIRFKKLPDHLRKKVGQRPAPGSPDRRSFWQPRLVIDGKAIDGVPFDAWRTQWPKDNSELSGRTIEIFLPKDNTNYPSYFPYWLQISGGIGKAKIRIIDSGQNLKSPKPSLNTLAKAHTQIN